MGMSLGNGSGSDEDTAYQPLAEINITPFVDVMLVLLIIFMVAAPLMVAGVPVDLPNSSAARLSQPKTPMIVSLSAEGELFIREEQVSENRLVSRLAELRASEGDTVVYVRADKARSYGDVMDLLGRVGESGYQRLSLLSQPKISQGAQIYDNPRASAGTADAPVVTPPAAE